jgi:hypothetical protein
MCVLEDSWVGPGGVLLDGAIGGLAEGCRHPTEQSPALVLLGD